MIQVVNNCQQTIWPGVGQTITSPSRVNDADGGFQLLPGQSHIFAVPTNWLAGRVFARTGCTYDGGFKCAVGDCGGLSCSLNSGIAGVSLAEFSYSTEMDKTFYNLSLDSGYNLPIQVRPSASQCETYTCGSAQCSDSQAYQPWSDKNPCMGCTLNSGYIVTFCPA